MTRLFLLTSLLLVACSPARVREPVAPILVEGEVEKEPSWSIARADFEQVLKDGLQPVMRWYFLAPAYNGDAFVGYEVVEVLKPELEAGPVRSGDVLLAVNDQPIERPEHALAIWRQLWGRKTISVDLLRDGRPRRYVIPIVSEQ
jgi:type II secretory pathway component PulC